MLRGSSVVLIVCSFYRKVKWMTEAWNVDWWHKKLDKSRQLQKYKKRTDKKLKWRSLGQASVTEEDSWWWWWWRVGHLGARGPPTTPAPPRYLGFVETVTIHLVLDGASNGVCHSAVDVDRVRSARRQVLATPATRQSHGQHQPRSSSHWVTLQAWRYHRYFRPPPSLLGTPAHLITF